LFDDSQKFIKLLRGQVFVVSYDRENLLHQLDLENCRWEFHFWRYQVKHPLDFLTLRESEDCGIRP